jgi:hypothetical protein
MKINEEEDNIKGNLMIAMKAKVIKKMTVKTKV